MDFQYRTTYSDKHGVETTTMHNDGARLALTLRGVLFSGPDFDSLAPESRSEPLELEKFSLANSCLCECVIECEIPIPVVSDGATTSTLLVTQLRPGSQAANGGVDDEGLLLSLRVNQKEYRSTGKSGWFEDELLELQRVLPAGAYMKACINCGLSDYSPYGHGLFGWMLCFRDFKAEYHEVKGKSDLFRLMEAVGEPLLVQETFLCPQFEKRQPGAGYRG